MIYAPFVVCFSPPFVSTFSTLVDSRISKTWYLVLLLNQTATMCQQWFKHLPWRSGLLKSCVHTPALRIIMILTKILYNWYNSINSSNLLQSYITQSSLILNPSSQRLEGQVLDINKPPEARSHSPWRPPWTLVRCRGPSRACHRELFAPEWYNPVTRVSMAGRKSSRWFWQLFDFSNCSFDCDTDDNVW